MRFLQALDVGNVVDDQGVSGWKVVLALDRDLGHLHAGGAEPAFSHAIT
jgi:hypothetical protein